MNILTSPKICLFPQLAGLGGMVTFQHKLTRGFQKRGIEVCFDLNEESYDAVLVTGGTRHLDQIWRANRQKIPVVQRLDGMNWLHRINRSNLRHYLRAEYGNLILRTIRNRLASKIVYQSNFVLNWWNDVSGTHEKPHIIIYNGVDLDKYAPNDNEKHPTTPTRLLIVEGNIMGGYEWGLENAVELAMMISDLQGVAHSHIDVTIVGRVAQELQKRYDKIISERGYSTRLTLDWLGVVSQDKIPAIDQAAHLLYSSDVNPACPNSVIEALACGLPVIAFNTGAISELVSGDAGRVVAYGGDPWKLEKPDIPGLAAAALEILNNQEKFRKAARMRAEKLFSLDDMVEKYLGILLG
jgi:glycosyltransferase involved in cell wall biosynthesis